MKLSIEKTIKGIDKKVEVIVSNETTSKSQKMKDLFQLGLEVKEIAVIMNVRYNFVYNVISNQIIVEGLAVETVKKESKKDKVIELHIEGKTNKEIAIELKTNYNYIYKIVKEYKDGVHTSDEQTVESK